MRRVRSPGGEVWYVGRRWTSKPRWRWASEFLPERPPKEHKERYWHEAIPDPFDPALVWLLVLVAAGFLVAFVGIPLLVYLGEIAWVVVSAIVSVALRLLFRRPWTVEARRRDDYLRWQVVGWRESGELIDKITARIRAGGHPLRVPAPGAPEQIAT